MALKNLTELAKGLVPIKRGKHPASERGQSRSTSVPEPLAQFGAGWPRLDLEETDDALRVTAEVPGLDPADIDVTITEHNLIIRGSRSGEKEERGKDYHLKETFSGSFYRSVPLPAEVDRDRAEATCRDGQLKLFLPKTESGRAATRKIEVK